MIIVFVSMIFSMKVVFRNKWLFLVEISEFFYKTFEANHILIDIFNIQSLGIGINFPNTCLLCFGVGQGSATIHLSYSH
jgi:hypothetical protein